jgi:ribonuclease VapC
VVIDTSAILAILFDEPSAERLEDAVASDPVRLISAGNVLEAGIVVEARLGEVGGRELDLLLHGAGIETVPVDADQVALAREAWRRFGRGRHRARLSFGDCFAYALARTAGEPLLFVGDDFALTDVAVVSG